MSPSNLAANNDAAPLLEFAESYSSNAVRTIDVAGVPAVVTKEGYKVELKPDLLPNPSRRKGFVAVASLKSFADYFNRFKGFYPNAPIIFVDTDPKGQRGATYKGILNYHGADTGAKPDHCDFGVGYTAELSVDWQKWMAKSGRAMLHSDFVEHLEDVMEMIVTPPGADLLKLIGDLEGTKNARFANALNLHNGRMKLNYEEDVTLRGAGDAGAAVKPGDIEVPTEIACGIAPFEYGQKYKVRNRIRYRVQNRQLAFSYEAIDPHLIIQEAVKIQIKELADLTATEPFQGKL